MKNSYRFLIISVVTICINLGCKQSSVEIPQQNEIVLAEGNWIQVKHPTANLRIEAKSGSTRIYYWDGIEITVNHIPRKERWNGSLGIYNPAASVLGFGDQLPTHQGINRAVVEEGQRHYHSEEEAHNWLVRREGSAINSYVWTTDGLVVNFSIIPGRAQMNIDLWQFYINGEKPKNLKGAQNNLFSSYVTYTRSQQVDGSNE